MTPEQTRALEERLILEAIFVRYGYDFRGYTAEVIGRRLELARERLGVSSLGELQHHLLVDGDAFLSVLDCLTLRVSDVFRDPEFFAALRREVLPHLRTYPTLKVWLAGCANGEEVYSTAILLHEEGLLERATIYATDVNLDALREAKEGIYAESRLPTFVENYEMAGGKARFEDYCTVRYEGVAMADALKRQLVFFHHNLATDYSLGEMNLAFCRNVMIYFGAELRERTLKLLRDCLYPGGYLCLGMSESLPQSVRGSLLSVDAATRIFRVTEAA